ncbi:MAG: alanine racemase [Candidatus Binatia bacterium]|nr:alanine racemase [Candidatus Binatia bacterium]MDG1959913.1 alanine racemase [Candidatus Binatia bacterium]MDG2010026.1 alanine racemase [Candidatus Binatia bacterium]HAC81939.1 alanine racemase [Deltaproteobacteria bacterium]
MADRTAKGLGNRRAVARIDLAALSHNTAEIRRITGPGVQLCAVVKADAYGHGAVPVARHLVRCGVEVLAVASVEEASQLRDAGIPSKILVFGDLTAAETSEAIRLGLTATLGSVDAARTLREVVDKDQRLPVHLKIDTGMRRIGFSPAELAGLPKLLDGSGLVVAGAYSHLAHGDSPGHESHEAQKVELLAACENLSRLGIPLPMRHLAGSAGLFAENGTHLDMVRTGIALYGGLPHPGYASRASLKPVMEVITRVAQVRKVTAGDGIGYGHTWRAPRDSRIAVLPIGYGQGYLRSLSNRGYTMIRGRLAPVVGTISMDQTMIDVTAAGSVKPGDEVTLWGGTAEGAPDVMELAERAGTIGYELLTRVGNTVPRTYIEPFG